MNTELDRLIAARKPEVKQCPQVGDVAWVSYNDGVTIRANQHIIGRSDVKWHDLGELFKTKEECERNIEALKVQAELRRMPGVVVPVFSGSANDLWSISSKQIRGEHGEICHQLYVANHGFVCLAVAGVWFESQAQALHALKIIGGSRIEIWLDDYLQTPIGGE